MTLAQFWSVDRIPAGGHYGDPRDDGTRLHRGTDYTHGEGVAIPSPVSGRVISKLSPAPSHGFGYQVTIQLVSGVRYSFAHMRSASPLAVGAQVKTGQIIGAEGHTGATTGPCVHVEYWNGAFHDPAPYVAALTQSGAAGGGSAPVTSPPPTPPTERENDTMKLWYCSDNNGVIWTLVDTANRVFDQTRDQARANLWAILYTESNQAKNIISSGNLAMALPGYTHQAWPFPPK